MTANRKPNEKRDATLVRSSYRPTKADMEETILPTFNQDGSRMTPEQIAKAVLRPERGVRRFRI